MGVALQVALVIIIIIFIGAPIVLFYDDYFGEPVKLESYKNSANSDPVIKNTLAKQFYPSMRFRDSKITYTIEKTCSFDKTTSIYSALDTIMDKTIISFQELTSGGEMQFLCSQVAPQPDEVGHFVAGEGGPTKIINTTNYAVILSEKVSLYRDEKCPQPKIALHEILHGLGFDHINNSRSILYPITDCNQVIDDSIISEIALLYRDKPLPDLIIENATANITGKYINFDVTISNMGLENAKNVTLNVKNGDSLIKSFNLENIDIGAKKFYRVLNLKFAGKLSSINFETQDNLAQSELSYSNNKASLNIPSG